MFLMVEEFREVGRSYFRWIRNVEDIEDLMKKFVEIMDESYLFEIFFLKEQSLNGFFDQGREIFEIWRCQESFWGWGLCCFQIWRGRLR